MKNKKEEPTIAAVISRLDALGTDMGNLRADVSGLHGEMKKTRSEVKELKWEVRIYDKELGAIRDEITSIRKDTVTKDDLKNFITSDKFEKVAVVVMKNSEGIVVIKEMAVETNKQVHVILNQIDAFRKSVEYFDKKVVFHKLRHDEASEKIGDHEKRITALEKAS